jgi:hypothetical protein
MNKNELTIEAGKTKRKYWCDLLNFNDKDMLNSV